MKVRIKWKPAWGPVGVTPEKADEDPVPAGPRPQSLVDIHSHILWGMDDGSRDLDESLAMLKMAADHGTTDIVATPHASSMYKFEPALIAERIAALRERVQDLPRIHTGCDFHLYVPNINDALSDPHKYTINGLSYLMVEFPDLMIPSTSDQILRKFIDLGIKPVITHPERNPILYKEMDRLQRWVSMGCFIQVTAQAVTDRFGKSAQQSAWSLLRSGMVHAVASDAHDTGDRTTRLDGAWRAIQRELGDGVASKLFIDNPGAIIQGKPLPTQQMPAPSVAETGSPHSA